MSSSAAIATYQGPLSAQERAAQKWGMDSGLSLQEDTRHYKMMAAIRRLEKAEHEDRVAREEPRDMNKWRRRYNAHLKKQLRDTCRVCLGTGQITVSDGHGCVEYDACPRCSWFEPYGDDYPTADDAMDVEF